MWPNTDQHSFYGTQQHFRSNINNLDLKIKIKKIEPHLHKKPIDVLVMIKNNYHEMNVIS